MKEIRKRLTYANVMSSLAVFMVLGGGAAVASNHILPKNSVGTPQLKRNAVKVGKVGSEAIRAGKLAKNAVSTNRLRDNAVTGGKIANGAVLTDKLADLGVTSGKLANDSVLTDKIAAAAVTTGKIADSAVDTQRLANGAVRAAKFGPVTIRENTVTVGENSIGTVVVSCLGGEQLLSGGGGFNLGTVSPHPQVIASINEGINGWRARGFNPAGFNRTLTVRAICLNS